ncbi:MAG: hypothetical protein MUD01_13070 [Chloroflexaceae bacterium]|jgi:hypothetical protein|nr:hypothetical protein [Chloroflexaceae bacterium]
MHELIPIAAGMVIGLGVQTIRSVQLRSIVLAVLALLVGAAVSWMMGELEIFWGFISFDAALVWFGALVSVVLAAAWRRRAARA